MSKAPPIPPEQRSFAGAGSAARLDSARPDRRDLETGLKPAQAGKADLDTAHQGRFANIRQNLTPQRRTQDR